MSEANYSDINNDRVYPALSRLDAGVAAKVIIQALGSPQDAAPRSVYVGNGVWGIQNARRADLRRKLRSWTSGHKSGARRVWVSTKPTRGHHKGWGRLIHDVSHMLHAWRHPKERPHGHLHPAVEREVQIFVEQTFFGNG